MSRRFAALALVITLLATACGSDEPKAADVLRDATENIRSVRSGTMSLGFVMTDVTSGARVGFEVEGMFGVDTDQELPIADLTYTQIAGHREQTFDFMSDGTRAIAIVDGTVTELAPEQLSTFDGFGGTSAVTGPLPGLQLDTWFDEPRIEDRGDTYLIEGVPRGPEVVQGLVELLTAYGSSESVNVVTDFGDADRESLDRAIHDARVLVEVNEAEMLLSDLTVDLTFSDADGTLGGLVDSQLTFDFALDDIGQPVSVDLPAHP
jgi:hypothetical protein